MSFKLKINDIGTTISFTCLTKEAENIFKDKIRKDSIFSDEDAFTLLIVLMDEGSVKIDEINLKG